MIFKYIYIYIVIYIVRDTQLAGTLRSKVGSRKVFRDSYKVRLNAPICLLPCHSLGKGSCLLRVLLPSVQVSFFFPRVILRS